jgi:hypothetical protein
VVNLASAGMSLPRMRELIERWAGRFDFDVIVVYPTPAFYLEDQLPRRARSSPAAPTGARPPVKAQETGAFRLSLRIPEKLWGAARQTLPAGLQARLKEREIARAREAHPLDWVWRQAPAERVALFESDLRDVVAAVEAAGARAVLATHAHRFSPPLRGAESQQMVGWIRFYPRATAECLLDMEEQAQAVVRRIAADHGLSVVDVQSAVGKDPAHYADFSHFTDDGARRAADALAAELLRANANGGLATPSRTEGSALAKDEQVSVGGAGQAKAAEPH